MKEIKDLSLDSGELNFMFILLYKRYEQIEIENFRLFERKFQLIQSIIDKHRYISKGESMLFKSSSSLLKDNQKSFRQLMDIEMSIGKNQLELKLLSSINDKIRNVSNIGKGLPTTYVPLEENPYYNLEKRKLLGSNKDLYEDIIYLYRSPL